MFKSRKSKMIVKYASYVGVIVLVVTSSVAFLSYRFYNSRLISERSKYEMELQQKEVQLATYEKKSRAGWVLTNELEAGSIIQNSDVQQSLLPDFFTPENVITSKEEVVGKVIKINAQKLTAVTKEMVYEDGALEQSERKEEVEYVRLPVKLQKNDTVDIRIVFPNGEDYIVVAKKKIKELDQTKQQAFFEDNEEEALMLQAALVDAYINNAELYMRIYVEPEMQETPTPNYVPNLSVIAELKTNSMIINQAKWKLAEDVRKGVDRRMKALDPTSIYRIGADAPAGSAVGKKKLSDGAVQIKPTNNLSNQVNDVANPTGGTISNSGLLHPNAESSSGANSNKTTDNSSSTNANNIDSNTDKATVYPNPQPDIPDATKDAEVPDMLGGK